MCGMAEKLCRKKWDNKDMVGAMEAVRNTELTIYSAAAKFKVPRKTLDDRIKGHVRHGTKSGPSIILSEEEESALESYRFYMTDHAKAYAWAIAKRTDHFNSEVDPPSPNISTKN